MQVSAGITEKEYFQEQSAFAEYRMKNRIFWETTVICGIFILAGIAVYIIRQRLRIQRERNDRYLLLAEEARAEYRALTRQLEGRQNTEKTAEKAWLLPASTSSTNSEKPITNARIHHRNRQPCFRK